MKAVKVLDLDYVPDLYFYQDPVPNAFTYGVDDAIVCVSSGALDLLSEQELLFVMGHELAHVQMGHVLYRTAAYILLNLGGMLGSMIGIGGALLTPIILAFMHWQRCSELSADRGGLLCVRYFATSVDTQMKLAGGSMKIAEKMDPDQFLAQAEDAGGMVKESIINMLIMAQMGVHATHPFIVWRAGALKDWAYKGDYLDILSGNYKRRNKGGSAPAEFDEKEFKKEDNEEDFFDQLRNMFTFSS
jgi:Zn-dependent protease with chaperone function